MNDGDDIWNKFVKRHKNILLVLSGHIKGDGAGRLVSTGIKGNKVYQRLSNYQKGVTGSLNGSTGFLRIMTFYHSKKIIRVKTYSPKLDKWHKGSEHEFEIDLARGEFR